MGFYIVSRGIDRHFHTGNAVGVRVEHEDPAEEMRLAAEEGMEDLEAEFPDETEPMHTVFVVPADTGVYFRATMAAERVPDEYQCCGGMPAMVGIGACDQHTAPCLNDADD